MYKSELHANSPTTHVNNNSPFPIKDDWTSNTVSLILATLNEIFLSAVFITITVQFFVKPLNEVEA